MVNEETVKTPGEYMAWYLSVTLRFISPPLMEPAMVYHDRGYTNEALLGCVRNVIERVQCREGMDLPIVGRSIHNGN
ncbi:hypothetical protein H6P81_013804 [Aristolochia fimbriata]|uniref:Uncharacterized protein n=1 Tax=Aristolochia fimbriata TaxID=158543 RepID=A0AAV7EJ05_ARIFI|nr:hypothetical protein H6P81_013804 [Aristolochia fimbriata]